MTNPLFSFWPTDHKAITQKFGENPQWYKPLAGHDGIDIVAPLRSPYYAVAEMTITRVSNKKRDGSPSKWGWYIQARLNTDGPTMWVTYAHALAPPDVTVIPAEIVAPGQIIGYSGNTGRTTGPHLHFVLWIEGYTAPGWKQPLWADPWPYLQHLVNNGI